MKRSLLIFLATILVVLPSAWPESTLGFNRDIRALLSDKCFYCHGPDGNKRKAGLRLDEAAPAYEGAIVPGKPEESLLVERIEASDPDEIMPPPSSNRQLSEAEKALLKRWIAEGARYETHWAFEPPRAPEVPIDSASTRAWSRSAIDAFLLQEMTAHDFTPSPEADRRTLIRRLAFDLIGLPPSMEWVEAFQNDARPGAYEALVDRFLASPQYGERMALPWLDAARYADSNGFQQEGDTWQWMWRDWVVQAMNADLPFDQFTTWQLAGDLLPDATTEQKIASGFNRNHLLNGEGGAIPEEQRFVILFDRVDTTATTWLGLTMACAQCHDHKYDPITMRDYYAFMDAFNRVPETGTPQRQSVRIRVAKPFLELPTEANRERLAEFERGIADAEKRIAVFVEEDFAKWRETLTERGDEGLRERIDALPPEARAVIRKDRAEWTGEEETRLEAGVRAVYDETEKGKRIKDLPAMKEKERLERELRDYRGDQIPRPMVMSDAQPRQTHILDRGEYLSPLEKVSFATPSFLPDLPGEAPHNRLGLAQWLVSPEHPLTARVQVNRMWQHFFGQGIVKTSEDFGVQSAYPMHRPLLDWMALRFREGGWSAKAMHRLITTSAAYRQSSRWSEAHRERDPQNRFFSRATRMRLPSMLLRDVALAASGLLDQRVAGAPVYPYQPERVWEPLAITKERDFTYPKSSGADLYRRSLYTFWRRTVQPANMFDASSRQACRVRLSINNTPLHALTTLNDPTWVEAARVLAARCLRASAEEGEPLRQAFRAVLGRAPRSEEIERLQASYHKQQRLYAAAPESAKALLSVGAFPHAEEHDIFAHAALTAVCLTLLNVDEALTRE